ncbi:DUF2267 domain-containing protein [Streptomyces johnsoniae]|uniref:DUF2267 domain-containing protein n=1 Tax=Streptomyces johnsoniae TaxID=3075532 RepID=A0ABU2S0F2_9ACTN|nr:DUF2267 domain-containing protein [Streptomyces sp. DSM 41886]MDT0442487.1 DUF2267 domain-containing protein [Streptomyces sp. DSM 41886]
MSYSAFLSTVRERGEYPADEAERIVESVLTTLGRRLPGPSAEHLADQLPMPLAEILHSADDTGRSWGVEEFISNVADHADEDVETAETDTRVVFSVLSERVAGGAMNKLLSQLPSGYADLFGYAELT